MKKIISILIMLLSYNCYAQEDCNLYLEKINQLISKNQKIDEAIRINLTTQTKYFKTCKGEVLGLDNPIVKNLEKLSYITTFYKGKAVAQNNEHEDVIIDENFAITKKLEFTTVRGRFSYGLAQVNKRKAKVTLNDKWGYINTNGDIVIPIIYDDVWGFEEGISKVQLKNKQGYIDTTGKEIIPVKFQYVWNLNQQIKGMILVHNKTTMGGRQKEFGLFDKFGNEILKPIYDQIILKNGMLLVTLNNKKYFVNMKGEFVKDYEEN